MKKILALILVTFMLVSLFACNASNSTYGDQNNPGNSSTEGNENGNGEHNPSDSTNLLNSDAISHVYGGYSEGLLWVQKEGETKKLYCIDKSGNVKFSIDGIATNAYEFSNEFAAIELRTDGLVICDKTGKITTAEDLGGQEILRCDFAADYILVKRSTTTYMGTTNELATFNTKFEKIVDFSSDLYEIYENNRFYAYAFIDKYLLFFAEDKYLDLSTGNVMDGKASLRSEIKVERESDFWVQEGYWGSVGGFYIYSKLDDILRPGLSLTTNRTTMLNLNENEKYAKIDEIGEFKNGMAPVTFEVNDNGNYTYYYTMMDEEGNFKFEPVKTSGAIIDYSFEDGYFVCTISPNKYVSPKVLEVYDMTGKLVAQKDYTYISSLVVSDGIVIVEESKYHFYTMDLKPIF